jgi:hypothetical protein
MSAQKENEKSSFKSAKETSQELSNCQSDYLKHLDNLKNTSISQEEHALLEKVKSAVIDYFYIKAIDDCRIDPNAIHVKVIIKLMDELFILYQKSFDEEMNQSESQLYTTLKLIAHEILPDTMFLLNCISFDSINFCNKFIENNGLKILFDYLNNSKLLNTYLKYSKNTNSNEFKNIDCCMRRVIGSIVCIARVYSNNKNVWKEAESVKNLMNYLKFSKNILDNKIYTALAIAYTADDDDCESLPELKDILPDIVKVISTASKMIKEESVTRVKLQIDENSNELKSVCCVTHLDTQWSLINLLKALYHMAVCDKLKYDIYYKQHMNKYLRMIIYHGNDVEREYCLNLLWQLCFDKQIALDVKEDNALFDFISNLAGSESKSNERNVQKYASGILWMINKKLNASSPTECQANNQNENQVVKFSGEQQQVPTQNDESNVINIKSIASVFINKHIMISYNRDSRDLCLQIKGELESLGYRIWIDVEDIHGSSLESMAKAIEDSFCVLMCMTEKYKQSTNCRAEAEYAFQLNKPIIPLIMQKDYKPDGWLGIILGSKIFVNFTRYEFSECMRRLKLEIKGVHKSFNVNDSALAEMTNEKPIKEVKTETQLKPIKEIEDSSKRESNKKVNKEIQNVAESNQVEIRHSNTIEWQKTHINELGWDEAQVSTWLRKKRIHGNIVRLIEPCDGQLLYELFVIKRESPDFFYKSLSLNINWPTVLRDLAIFSLELKSLFS